MTSPRLPSNRDANELRLEDDLAALGRTSTSNLPNLADTRRSLARQAETQRGVLGLPAARRRPALVATAAALALVFIAPLSYALVTDGLRLFVDADRSGDEIADDLREQFDLAGFDIDIDVDDDRSSFTIEGDTEDLFAALAESESGLEIDFTEEGDSQSIRLSPDLLGRMLDRWLSPDSESSAVIFKFDPDGEANLHTVEGGSIYAAEDLPDDVLASLRSRLSELDLETASSEELAGAIEDVFREHEVEIPDDVAITIDAGELGTASD